jgi:Leucine-rich repeat (LRR) protein
MSINLGKITIIADKLLIIDGIEDLNKPTKIYIDRVEYLIKLTDLNDINKQEITEIEFKRTYLNNLPDDLSTIFPNFKKLTLSNNTNLTSLSNLSNLPNLNELIITNNEKLTVLPDLSRLTELRDLTWNSNGLTDFSILSEFTRLAYFDCANNNLTELPNLSGCTYLRRLNCSNNQLTELSDYLSGFKYLQKLSCANNKLTELSMSQKLVSLDCANNELTKLSISPNLSISPELPNLPTLMVLDCANNQLTELPDLSQFDDFRNLTCANNQLTELPALPISTNHITISIDQIGLLINDNYAPTNALNTLNVNSESHPVEIRIYDIDVKRFIKEPPPPNENENKFYYDKILNDDETYKFLIRNYNEKLNALYQYQNRNFKINTIQYLQKFKKYVTAIKESVKLKEALNVKSIQDKKEEKKLTVLKDIYTKNSFGGKKSKKSKKSKKTKKTKKSKKSKKSKKTSKSKKK